MLHHVILLHKILNMKYFYYFNYGYIFKILDLSLHFMIENSSSNKNLNLENDFSLKNTELKLNNGSVINLELFPSLKDFL